MRAAHLATGDPSITSSLSPSKATCPMGLGSSRSGGHNVECKELNYGSRLCDQEVTLFLAKKLLSTVSRHTRRQRWVQETPPSRCCPPNASGRAMSPEMTAPLHATGQRRGSLRAMLWSLSSSFANCHIKVLAMPHSCEPLPDAAAGVPVRAPPALCEISEGLPEEDASEFEDQVPRAAPATTHIQYISN